MSSRVALHNRRLAFLLSSIIILSLILSPQHLPATSHAATGSFTFAAAGDFGDIMGTAGNNFQNLKNHYPSLSFVVLLGDLSYGANSPAEFCGTIKNTYGFQTLAVTGNHDDGEISGYAAACSLPPSWSFTGNYFQNYYLDWPQPNPIARFIATGAGTTNWDPTFVSTAIDQAHSQGLWVFVFQHKDCITTGSKDCAVGSDYMDLLLSRGTDVWMEGHDHNYQRSKQLSCAVVDSFNPACIADSDSSFSKGAGTVLVNSGTGGKSEYSVDPTDPEAGYFQVINDNTHGFSIFTVSSTTITETFLALDGPLQDSFTITSGPPPRPSFDFSLSTIPQSITLTPAATTTVTVNVNLVSGTTQKVTLSTTCPNSITCLLAKSIGDPSFSTTLTVSASPSTPTGDYRVSLAGTNGTLTRSTQIAINVRDFSITANPANMAIAANFPSTSTLTVTSINGFSGTVTLSYSISSARSQFCSANLSKSSLTLGTSDSSVLTLVCSRDASGWVTITAAAGLTKHTATIIFTTNPTFTLTASPVAIDVNAGSPAVSTITVAPANGFTGIVSLASAVSPAGLTCTLSPESINLGASQTSTLSCIGPTAATFQVKVTGTSGSLSTTTTVTVNVRDFTITTFPETISLEAGDSGDVTIEVSSVNEFTGSVTLDVSIVPDTGLDCTLDPASVALGISQNSTLECTSSAAGDYTLTITGTSGSMTKTAENTFQVESSTHNEPPASPPTQEPGTKSTGNEPPNCLICRVFNPTTILFLLLAATGAVAISALTIGERTYRRSLIGKFKRRQ